MTRDEIIDDLMRRRPKGSGKTKITYTVDDGEYDHRRRKYKQIAVPSDPSYGYSEETLFDLGFKELDDVRDYIRARDFEGLSDWKLRRRKATLARRSNAVWRRIEWAVHNIGRKGGEGVYSVSQGYGTSEIGNLFARNMEEAKESANLFFSYLFPGKSIRVKFIRHGSVDEITRLNQQTVSKIKNRIVKAEEEIKAHTARIEQFKAMMTTLQTVESQQIAIETVEALNRSGESTVAC